MSRRKIKVYGATKKPKRAKTQPKPTLDVSRRFEARRDDIRDLMRRRMPIVGAVVGGRFDWKQRYDLKYVLAYARKQGLNASRLGKAVATLDRFEKLAGRRKANLTRRTTAVSKRSER